MGFKKVVARTGLRLKQYSPEILTGVGIVSFIGTVVYACKQTTKAHDILQKYHDDMHEINEAKELAEKGNLIDEMGNNMPYEPEDIRKDKFGVVARTGVGFAKLYAGPAILGTVSITSFLAANNILKKRYLASVAAFNVVSNAFEKYRQRVIEEGGIDLDRHYMYGAEKEKIDIVDVDENGKAKKHKEEIENITSGNQINLYSKFFDESCKDWCKDPELNMLFLRGQEEIATQMLHERGHLFLNEVYDMLDIERTGIGAMVGWVDGVGDSFVDFGLFKENSEAARRFVNGCENVILLDFNVDGYICDKIDMRSEGSGRIGDIYDYPQRYKSKKRRYA